MYVPVCSAALSCMSAWFTVHAASGGLQIRGCRSYFRRHSCVNETQMLRGIQSLCKPWPVEHNKEHSPPPLLAHDSLEAPAGGQTLSCDPVKGACFAVWYCEKKDSFAMVASRPCCVLLHVHNLYPLKEVL